MNLFLLKLYSFLLTKVKKPKPLPPPEPVVVEVDPTIHEDPMPEPEKFERNYLAPGVIEAAKNSQKKWGVPASVTLAQFILESDWGTKNLGVYNFFGIKDLSWDPGSIVKTTKEYVHGEWVTVDCPFEDFDSVDHCFDIHGRLLAKSRYYKGAMEAKDDPDEFARRLTGIYATDPMYGSKLISIMKKYNLYEHN